MALYAGYKGRGVLVGPDLTSYNLFINKFILATKTQEEDVTTASSVNLPQRTFVAATIPRIDVQLEGFWTSKNNPFGAANPLLCGFNYVFQLFFDKANAYPNVNALLLVTGCEVQSSVRDVVRYIVTGVLNAPAIHLSNELFPRFFPVA